MTNPLISRLAIFAVTAVVTAAIPALTQGHPVLKFAGHRYGPVIIDRATERIIDQFGPPAPSVTPAPTPSPTPAPAPAPAPPDITPAPPDPDQTEPTFTERALRVLKGAVKIVVSLLLLI